MTRIKPIPILGLNRRKVIPRNKAVISIESVRQIGPYGTGIFSSISSVELPANISSVGVYDDEYKKSQSGINPIAVIVPIEVKL